MDIKVKNMNIKVGDHVRVTERHLNNYAKVGMTGIITDIDNTTVPYEIKIDESCKCGHDGLDWCVDVELINREVEMFPIY